MTQNTETTNGQYIKESVSQAYGGALLEMATEQGVLDEVADEVDQVLEMLSDLKVRRLLCSPSLGVGQRAGVIERLFKGRITSVFYRFLHVVNRKGRAGALKSILQAFGERLAEQRGIVEVDLFVATRLDESQLKDVAVSVSKSLNREAVVHQYEDPSLIGGMKLRIGDRVIDGSVSAQLKMIKRKLTRAGREKARQHAAEQG